MDAMRDRPLTYPYMYMDVQALVPTNWGLEIVETLARERTLVACVPVMLHNRLVLASSSEGAGEEEERAAAAEALVCFCFGVCGCLTDVD